MPGRAQCSDPRTHNGALRSDGRSAAGRACDPRDGDERQGIDRRDHHRAARARSGSRSARSRAPIWRVINERITRNSEPITDAELIEVLASLAALEPLLDGTAHAIRSAHCCCVPLVRRRRSRRGGRRGGSRRPVGRDERRRTGGRSGHERERGPPGGARPDADRRRRGEGRDHQRAGAIVVLGETDPHWRTYFSWLPQTVSAATACGGGDRTQATATSPVTRTTSPSGAGSSTFARPGGRYEQVFFGLHGAHQGDNAAVALAAAEAFFARPAGRRHREDGTRVGEGSRAARDRRAGHPSWCSTALTMLAGAQALAMVDRGRLRSRRSEGGRRRDCSGAGIRSRCCSPCIGRRHTGRHVPCPVASGTARCGSPCRRHGRSGFLRSAAGRRFRSVRIGDPDGLGRADWSWSQARSM